MADLQLDRKDAYYTSDICKERQASKCTSSDPRCRYFQSNARKWWKVDILMNALSALNCPVTVECVSETGSDSPVMYIPSENKVEISASSFISPFGYRRSLARGLVYAFDNARANVNYGNLDHLTCTSIRAANLSGECDLWTKWTEYIGEDPLGLNMYSMKQRCIRKKVGEQILLTSSSHSSSSIEESLDRVWERCFRDHWPFTTDPHMDTRYRESPLVRSS